MNRMQLNRLGMGQILADAGNPLEGIDFGVREFPLTFDQDGRKVSTPMRAIVRDDTGMTIGLVGADYVVHDHRPALLSAIEALRELGKGDVRITNVVNKAGGRFWSHVELPALGRGRGADELIPRFTLGGSFDGSSNSTGALEFLRKVCSNGAMRWVAQEGVRSKHSSSLRLEALRAALDRLPEMTERYNHLRKSLVGLPAPKPLEEMAPAMGRDTALAIMGEPYAAEARIHGAGDAWAAYQGSTRYLTGLEVSEERRGQVLTKVEGFFLALAGIKV